MFFTSIFTSVTFFFFSFFHSVTCYFAIHNEEKIDLLKSSNMNSYVFKWSIRCLRLTNQKNYIILVFLIFLFSSTTTNKKIEEFLHTITLNRIVQQRNFCSIVYWKRHHRTQNDVHTLNLLSLRVWQWWCYYYDILFTIFWPYPCIGTKLQEARTFMYRKYQVWTRVCVTFACKMFNV